MRVNHNIKASVYKSLNSDKEINKFFGVKYVGRCMKLLREYRLSTPNFTFAGWNNYYLKNILQSQLDFVSLEIQKKGYDVEVADEYVMFRTVGQTWNGLIAETDVKKLVEESFDVEVNYADDETDRTYCVDLESEYFAIQVKPITYKTGSNPSLNRDKQIHKRKHLDYEYATDRKVFFAFYSGEVIDQSFINEINVYLELKSIY